MPASRPCQCMNSRPWPAGLHVRRRKSSQIKVRVAPNDSPWSICHAKEERSKILDVNKVDENGETPIISAIKIGDIELVKQLILSGSSLGNVHGVDR